ncbi:MAG: adenylate/guanylate cyclase domain-containing protein [Actinomycetota bacterium]
MTDTTTLERARHALDQHAWQEAYEALASIADRGGLSAEDLERLAEAAWWSAHPTESIEAFERAYAAFSAAGEPRRAAGVALRLAMEYADRLDSALWNGWLQRASRLLADQPESFEQGWLELCLVRASFERGEMEEGERHAIAAHEIGTRLGDPDLEAFGLALQGAILVMHAQIEEGLSLVDEATLAAVGGELTPYIAGNIYCLTIGICRSVADYRRAAEWTEAATRWCEREAITGFPGVCRVNRAEIMRLRGAYAEAEEEASKALVELEAFGRAPQAGAGAYELGEVRLHRGNLDGAEEAFERAHQLGHEPQPGMALLRLARGRIDAARASIGTALEDTMIPVDRARLLPARVEIALSAYDVADAREAAEELAEAASAIDAPMLHAAAHQALGAVLTYEENAAAAIAELRKAVRRWGEADAPFEAAQARRWLAVAYRAGGDEASALLELRAARDAFERLGAGLEVDRCDAMISAGDGRDAGRRVVRTFVFTDIVGSTDLIQTIGDEAWEDVLRWHDDTLRTQIASHRGEVVHTTGDGFFASFPDAATAASCAVAIQRRLAEHRRKHGFAPQVRIGLHSAEATMIVDDYAGLGVHEAARVGAIAEGGEILATVSSIEGATIPFEVGDEREVSLKGLSEPVRVVAIGWQEPG